MRWVVAENRSAKMNCPRVSLGLSRVKFLQQFVNLTMFTTRTKLVAKLKRKRMKRDAFYDCKESKNSKRKKRKEIGNSNRHGRSSLRKVDLKWRCPINWKELEMEEMPARLSWNACSKLDRSKWWYSLASWQPQNGSFLTTVILDWCREAFWESQSRIIRSPLRYSVVRKRAYIQTLTLMCPKLSKGLKNRKVSSNWELLQKIEINHREIRQPRPSKFNNNSNLLLKWKVTKRKQMKRQLWGSKLWLLWLIKETSCENQWPRAILVHSKNLLKIRLLKSSGLRLLKRDLKEVVDWENIVFLCLFPEEWPWFRKLILKTSKMALLDKLTRTMLVKQVKQIITTPKRMEVLMNLKLCTNLSEIWLIKIPKLSKILKKRTKMTKMWPEASKKVSNLE